jgi:hypothetical protein
LCLSSFLFHHTLFILVQSVPENTTVGSTVGIVNAIDEDFNQTLNYTTDNPSFTIVGNRLILTTQLSYNKRQFIPIIIRATDNGQPTTFVRKKKISFVIIKIFSSVFV